jgi:hypothetical protein
MNQREEHIIEYLREQPDLDSTVDVVRELQRQFPDATYGEVVHAMVYRSAELEGTRPPDRCTGMCRA